VFTIHQAEARSIISNAGGYLAQAGFSHSLTPARNCTFGCTYCYVPTLGVYGGLKREDWERWGQFTTFKSNAADLLKRALRPHQVIYCSPLVDPYQPAEESAAAMPSILDAMIAAPPRVVVIQTRGSLILRDIAQLLALAKVTTLRVSFSVTTDDDRIRRLYEPHCSSIAERLDVIGKLRAAGICTFATLAPLLPCNPEGLACAALEATGKDLIGDPLHVRATKPRGATTRNAASKIGAVQQHSEWLDPAFQQRVVDRISAVAAQAGRRFGTGPEGFSWLAKN
jgi:DNA repair photolyase